MSLIDPTVARFHLRVTAGEDDANIDLYSSAAEQMAIAYLNRFVYADADSLAQAGIDSVSTLNAAIQSYRDAKAANASLDPLARCTLDNVAKETLYHAIADARRTMRGIVINENIIAAMLLILGHLYANRQDVVADYRVIPTMIPRASEDLLMPYRIQMGV